MTTLLKKLFLPVTKRILTDSPKPLGDVVHNYNINIDSDDDERNDDNRNSEKDTSRKYLFLYTKKIKPGSRKVIEKIQQGKTPAQTRLEQIGLLSQGVFHDILNPLAALSLHIDQLQQKGFIKEYKLVEDMLESKKVLLCFMQQMQLLITEKTLLENFNLSKLIGDTIILIKNRATTHNITIIYADSSSIFFQGIACRLQQVLLVVINNAIDSCIQNNCVRNYVTVSVFQKDDSVHIVIKDTGCGLRVSKNMFLEKEVASCGIGLAHAREIIEKECGGTLFLNDRQTGVEVEINLPIASVSTAPILPHSNPLAQYHQ
jgi:signal transduction histidine kinase